MGRTYQGLNLFCGSREGFLEETGPKETGQLERDRGGRNGGVFRGCREYSRESGFGRGW